MRAVCVRYGLVVGALKKCGHGHGHGHGHHENVELMSWCDTIVTVAF